MRAAGQRFSCTRLASPGDGWCARWLQCLHQLGTASLPWQRPAKSPPTSGMVRTRPAKPPAELFCNSASLYPTQQSLTLDLAAGRRCDVRGLWKVSDAEDNEVTCLRRRRRGARNRSGQAGRQTSHGCESCCCGYGAGAAATPSAVQCQPHHAIDATSQRLSTKRCRSHRQRAARRSSARPSG